MKRNVLLQGYRKFFCNWRRFIFLFPLRSKYSSVSDIKALNHKNILVGKYYNLACDCFFFVVQIFLKNFCSYTLTSSHAYPGKFVLSYMPVSKVRHEYMTITPDGFRFRQQMFPNLNNLLAWFKVHYREPPPGGKFF